jgi:hypothetical protein
MALGRVETRACPMADLGAAVALVTVAVVCFGVSIRVGMLLGQRLDAVIEARMGGPGNGPAGQPEDEEVGRNGG